jgi:hypothetical protein
LKHSLRRDFYFWQAECGFLAEDACKPGATLV